MERSVGPVGDQVVSTVFIAFVEVAPQVFVGGTGLESPQDYVRQSERGLAGPVRGTEYVQREYLHGRLA